MGRSLYLVDPIVGGHHPTYLEQLVLQADAIGLSTVLVTPKGNLEKLETAAPDACFAYRSVLARVVREGHRFHAVALWMDLLINVLLCRLQGFPAPKSILLCWADAYRIPALRPFVRRLVKRLVALLLPSQWAGILFHPTHWRMPEVRTPERLVLDEVFSWPNCEAVGVLDHGLVQSGRLPFAEKAHPFPDIINDQAGDLAWGPIKTLQQRAQGKTIVSLLGVLAPRKGILPFLQLPERFAERHFFVLAGPVAWASYSAEEATALKRFLDAPPANVMLHLQSIKDGAQFNAFIEASDVLYAVYRQFPHASNLVVKAARFGKRILVAEGYYMAELVEGHQQGLAVDPEHLESIAKGLEEIGRLNPKTQSGDAILQANGAAAMRAFLGRWT